MTTLKVFSKKFAVFLAARIYKPNTAVVLSKELAGNDVWNREDRLEVLPLQDVWDPSFRRFMEPDAGVTRVLSSFAENGYSCFIARLKGTVIGYMWWVDNRIPAERNHPHLDRFGIQLTDHDAYLFNLLIAREFRGDGRADEFLCKIQSELRRMGYKRTLGFVDEENKPARWLYGLHNWKDLKTIRSWTFFSFVMLSKGAVFINNNRWSSPHKFDLRRILPLRR